ncbi:major facilitator superfamily domain-containing protein [Microdochium trichocladiopsis]|uniref:Major facilitator superfamily domain-containing protein n=1 Tax=Microdochium trichocladiopsis TaxID=1682393 RepID=A0A9P9BLD2_9PEZI|nr:major facilitator superfamily domain-containing protein [Microdochium trichocladiopsis]KAH7024774.1 major facilitator superfamily domain-containing protein [Microdochium trichocladiopsis]
MAVPQTETEENFTSSIEQGDEAREAVKPYHWYHGVFFNATIVGITAFAAPGLWNAMQSVGAGGQQSPYLVLAGNAILFTIMVFSCLSGSLMANRFGYRIGLIFGTVGYVIYSAALYTNNRYGTVWFIYLGSAACGISAGIFWATEGAIMLSYPEPGKRGRYLSYWLSYRNSGSILGGIINLAFNYRGVSTGKLDWRTYIVFVALQALGPGVAFFLSLPSQVVRRNGTKVLPVEPIPTAHEIQALWNVIKKKEILLTAPFFLYVTWSLPYISAYLTLYFSVRARALASLISAVAQVVSTLLFGAFLDWRALSLNKRARYGYIFMMALIGGTWAWGTVVQRDYHLHKPSLDWSDDGFDRGWALYVFWQINFSLTYNYGFWLISWLAAEPKDAVRSMSVIRGVEAAGQAISSGISSTTVPLLTAMGINFALWGVAVIPAYLVVRGVGEKYLGPEKSSEPAEEAPKI